MMNNIVTQFFLCQKLKPSVKRTEDFVLEIADTKKEILDLYACYCEEEPQAHFYVLKKETVTTKIAESDDVRQARFTF